MHLHSYIKGIFCPLCDSAANAQGDPGLCCSYLSQAPERMYTILVNCLEDKACPVKVWIFDGDPVGIGISVYICLGIGVSLSFLHSIL